MEETIRQELKKYYGTRDLVFQKWLKTLMDLTEKDILADSSLSPEQKTSLLECNREHSKILQEAMSTAQTKVK